MRFTCEISFRQIFVRLLVAMAVGSSFAGRGADAIPSRGVSLGHDSIQKEMRAASVAYALGDDAQATKHLEIALSQAKQLYGSRNLNVALVLDHLAAINGRQYGLAIRHLEESVAIQREFGGKSWELALALDRLARHYCTSNLQEQAVTLVQQELEIWKQLEGDKGVHYAKAASLMYCLLQAGRLVPAIGNGVVVEVPRTRFLPEGVNMGSSPLMIWQSASAEELGKAEHYKQYADTWRATGKEAFLQSGGGTFCKDDLTSLAAAEMKEVAAEVVIERVHAFDRSQRKGLAEPGDDLDQAERCLSLALTFLGSAESNDKALRALITLSKIKKIQGEYAKAADLYAQVVDIDKRTAADTDGDGKARMLANEARLRLEDYVSILNRLGRHGEAEKIQQDIIRLPSILP